MVAKYDVSEIREVFNAGGNISSYLREKEKLDENTDTSIMYTYDVQAGSYIEKLKIASEFAHRVALGAKIAGIISDLAPQTMLDAGVGEATSLVATLKHLGCIPDLWAFDISLSRLLYAQRHLSASGYPEATLFTGTIQNIPLPDSSVDLVLTVHAVESNGGNEHEVLLELTRVCCRHLVMIEPSYELGSTISRQRMEKHRYVKGLPTVLSSLGWNILRHEKWGVDFNPENEAALIIAAPADPKPANVPRLLSPISRHPLKSVKGAYFCPEDGHVFPVIDGIPCLLADNAILASHLETVGKRDA